MFITLLARIVEMIAYGQNEWYEMNERQSKGSNPCACAEG